MRTLVGLSMAALMAVAASYAFSPRATPVLAPTVLPVSQMHFNALVRSKAGWVAAGELGTIVVSADEGRSWERARVAPERQALINQVAFDADGVTGLAVGHEGWVLATRDGGRSWTEVAFADKNGEPLMSVARLPTGVWVAVGAFGRAIQSADEGRSWTPLPLEGVEVDDRHLNRIVGSPDGREWLVVGERGLVLQLDPQTLRWQTVPPFYKGSLYNAAALGDGRWVVYGMRGNAFYSSDGGRSWARAQLPVPASFFDHAIGADGRLVLVGQGGLLATSRDAGHSFTLARAGVRATLTGLQLLPDGSGWLASDAGLLPLPEAPAPIPTTPAAASGASR